MTGPRPPRLATRLLAWAAEDPEISAFLGDLHEIHSAKARRTGRAAAALWYWREILRVLAALLAARVIGALRPGRFAALLGAGAGAGRSLLRDKTYSLATVATLGVCIGANATVFGVVHTVLLEPLPFEQPDRLIRVFNSYPRSAVPRMSTSAPDYFHRKDGVPAFDQVAVYRASGHTVGEPGSATRTRGMRVSVGFFSLLGARPALGRFFVDGEMEPGAHLKVVLTHDAWLDYLGGVPDAVGRELRIDEQPHTVVGVLEEDFRMPLQPDARLFTPTVFTEADRDLDSWHTNRYQMIARLADGATIEQAEIQNAELNDRLIALWPRANGRQVLAGSGYATVVRPADDALVGDAAPLLYLLWAAAGFVLLIGCLNVGTLTLARSRSRVAEFATMRSLGASETLIGARVLAEALALATAGGVLGLGLAALGLGWVQSVGGADLPRGTDVSLDGSVLLVSLALAVGAALVVAATAFRPVGRQALSKPLRALDRMHTVDRRHVPARDVLATTQVGVAYVMLMGAGLMLVSLRSALSVDPGFAPDDVLTAYVPLPAARYDDAPSRRRFWDELLDEVRSLPGVRAASLSDQLPFTDGGARNPLYPVGYELAPGEALVSALQTEVGPGYFETMGIHVLRGRSFEPSDGPEDPGVVVIDEWMADRFWPGGDAVGAQVVWDVLPDAPSIPAENVFTVIGVVGTTKQSDLTSPQEAHRGAYYFTYRQRSVAFGMLAVAVDEGAPPAAVSGIRDALANLDPDLPLFNVATMRERIDQSLVRRRVPAALLGTFAAVALFLAATGIYGTLAYTVVQRGREIGIRMAMGASPDHVFRSVVSRGLRVTVVGVLLGVGGALLLSRLMSALLFQVTPADPRLMAAVGALLAFTAIAACWLPGRRATRVDPARVLEG